MSNFFEMGSSHIQPAWESNNNNKKKWRRGGEKALLLPFLSAGADRPGSEGGGGGGGEPGRAVRGRAGAAGAALCGGGTSATQPSRLSLPLDWGGEGDAGGAGCAAGGGSSATCVALCLAQTPVQALGGRGVGWGGGGGSFLGSPRIRLHFLRAVSNGVSVRDSALATVPSARTPWGSRHLFL